VNVLEGGTVAGRDGVDTGFKVSVGAGVDARELGTGTDSGACRITFGWAKTSTITRSRLTSSN